MDDGLFCLIGYCYGMYVFNVCMLSVVIVNSI